MVQPRVGKNNLLWERKLYEVDILPLIVYETIFMFFRTQIDFLFFFLISVFLEFSFVFFQKMTKSTEALVWPFSKMWTLLPTFFLCYSFSWYTWYPALTAGQQVHAVPVSCIFPHLEVESVTGKCRSSVPSGSRQAGQQLSYEGPCVCARTTKALMAHLSWFR